MISFKVDGAKRTGDAFKRLCKESMAADDVTAVVGYTASYALAVHEDLEQFHPAGQAKYLETPARQMKRDVARIVLTAKSRGLTTGQSLLLAGLKLQRESQLLVPVDTGNLRGSAFTTLEKNR